MTDIPDIETLGDGALLTLDEAAAIARHPKSTVRWWIATGKLRRHGKGRHPLIQVRELRAYLAPSGAQVGT